jgi:putative hydrolase of the HAD superfamily
MKVPGIIFDGDDTLWETASLYAGAKEEFFRQMSSLGFDLQEVAETFQNIDMANVDRFGFSMHRFPLSMAETYNLFCDKYSLASEQGVTESVRRIGYSVFTKFPANCAYAPQMLAQLRPHFRLILATKGDYEVQRSKINQSELAPFFHSIYILEHKTLRELQLIAEECDLDVSQSWVIGDSLKSDINPALRAGFRAIWIQHDTWEYEKDEQIISDKFFKVETLDDSLRLLLQE